MKEKIFNILDELQIPHNTYEHIPVFSCSETKGFDIPGSRVKSLLIGNKKATKFYMVVLPDTKKLNTNIIRDTYTETKLSFVSPELMLQKIGVSPGSVSPFALIHNIEKDVRVVFDTELQGKKIGLHPLQNDTTIVLDMASLQHFLENIGNEYMFLKC